MASGIRHKRLTVWLTLSDFCIAHNSQVRYAHFGVPATARGACQLEFIFPAGYSVGGPGSHLVNVWKTERTFDTTTDTWASAPKTTSLFGTVMLKSKPSKESRIVVNSGECTSMKDFKFTIADNNNSSSDELVGCSEASE